jgi:Tol biopolymer transport system component
VSGDGAAFLAGIGTKWRRVLLGGTDSDPSWSRDGQVVAFQRHRGTRRSILLLRPGADPRAIAQGREPRIAPDGEHVAFYRDSGLFVWSSDGTVTRVGPTGDGVDWSPDSTRLAWTNGNALYVAPRGGSPRLLTRNTRCDGERPADVGSAAWSPDGRTIAFGVEHGDAGCAELASVDVARGSIRSLGEGASARWSPDGTALAVEHPYEGIRIIDRSGTVLGRWDGGEPSWAPDSSWVAYSNGTGRPPTARHVYVRRRDGTGVRRLTSGLSINAEPTFRPASG